MANLFGTYDKRIKLTVSNTNIDAELTWFPVTVFLTSTAGEEVFAEFDDDTDFDRVAFTTSDGSTQLYADCELFDDSESKAIYHVSKTGWAISNTGTTDFYMYYDDNAAHNMTYISKAGDSGTQYPTAYSDTYVKATSENGVAWHPYYATDPSTLVTGTWDYTGWLASSNTNQRFHIDLGSAKIIQRIYCENQHTSGGSTTVGVKNFTFWGSNTASGTFDDLVYANDEGWTELTVSTNVMLEHSEADEADPQYITITNTTAYRYYAFKFADNHTHASWMGVRHIGLQTTVAAQSVYDGNFKAVYHMNDATTSTIYDSTSNNNDGTKKAANEPVEATGKVGQAQDFDGSDDDIALPSLGTTDTLTIESIVKVDTFADELNKGIVASRTWVAGKVDFGYSMKGTATDKWKFQFDVYSELTPVSNKVDFALDTYYYLAGTYDKTGTSQKMYYNDTLDRTITSGQTWHTVSLTDLDIGDFLSGRYANGIIDEVRISTNIRTAAWLKATYNSLYDTLLTYGSEETGGVVANAIFFGCNF